MKNSKNCRNVSKIVGTTSLLLVLGLYGGTASATYMPNGSALPEAAERNSIEHQEHYDSSGKGSEHEWDDHQRYSSAVPEAGTLVLLGAGFFGLAVYSKRRRAKEGIA
jgi:hypothetical protein